MTIRLEKIGKRFIRQWVFKDITAEFRKGEIIAITGPNGSGKSTLMQVLWGQTLPSAGNIFWSEDSKEIDPSDLWRFISIAAPYQDLIDEFTLSEQIDFHFQYKNPVNGIGKEELINALYLEDSRSKQIEHFSSGMRQRLRLGLALYSDAAVTFLDEPTTNMDQKGMDWYRQLLAEISNRLIFIATNNPSDYPEHSKTLQLSDFK